MRRLADRERIVQFMRALGREATAPGQVYFTGGATAVLLGWRPSTIDVDIKVVPDTDAILRAIPALKESLDLNVELAAPDDFIPVRDDWASRSEVVGREGSLTFHHYDLCAQALAKVERGHDQDLQDVEEMFARGLVQRSELAAYFRAVEPRLYRYPAIDPPTLAKAVARVTGA
jgi:hypothetical protein